MDFIQSAERIESGKSIFVRFEVWLIPIKLQRSLKDELVDKRYGVWFCLDMLET